MADDQDDHAVQAYHADHAYYLDRPYHSKRPHKKSRKGCRNCKVRKVKCDEARPTCRSCRLRKVECLYASSPASPTQADVDAAATHVATSPPSLSSSSSSPSAILGLAGSQSPPLSLANTSSATPLIIIEPLYRPSSSVDDIDMRLLWFYTTCTYTSFTVEGDDKRSVEDIMKNRLVRYAFETPFLMHSLFALAGLHLQSLGQPVEPGRALAYRAKAFEGYRMAIEEAKPETFPALLANSLLLTALSSQIFRDPDCPQLYIIDWMVVWRGIGLIVELISVPSLFESGLGSLFYRPSIDLDGSASSIPNPLLFMISSIRPDDPDFPDVSSYYDTLKYLGSLYLGLRKEGFGAIMNLRVITWFTFVPGRFINLCRERRPRALVILGHYSVFLKLIQAIWWLNGIGDRSIRDVCNYVAPDWHHFLEMPFAAARVTNRLEIARILLEDPSWTAPEIKPDDWNEKIDRDTITKVYVDDDGEELLFVGESMRGKLLRDPEPADRDLPQFDL